MKSIIIFLKWTLFIISIFWAVHATKMFVFLAENFPSVMYSDQGIIGYISSIQGYAIAFGPTIIALSFLLINWPNTK